MFAVLAMLAAAAGGRLVWVVEVIVVLPCKSPPAVAAAG
jgi:hypothetical protein